MYKSQKALNTNILGINKHFGSPYILLPHAQPFSVRADKAHTPLQGVSAQEDNAKHPPLACKARRAFSTQALSETRIFC